MGKCSNPESSILGKTRLTSVEKSGHDMWLHKSPFVYIESLHSHLIFKPFLWTNKEQ